MIEYEWDCEFEDAFKDDICFVINHILKRFSKDPMDVEVLITDGETVKGLNREYRNIDKTTDVLSFPGFDSGLEDVCYGYLGSIAISYERAKEQAEEYGHSLKREMCFLCTHGMLHLLGYDHVAPEEEAVMKELAEHILSDLEIFR